MSGSRPLKQGRSSTRLSGTTVETALPRIGLDDNHHYQYVVGDDEEHDYSDCDGDDDHQTGFGKNTPTVAIIALKLFKVANFIAMKTHLKIHFLSR